MESCEEIRAEALSLSHLTWETTRTINLHIFGSTSFPVYGQNIIANGPSSIAGLVPCSRHYFENAAPPGLCRRCQAASVSRFGVGWRCRLTSRQPLHVLDDRSDRNVCLVLCGARQHLDLALSQFLARDRDAVGHFDEVGVLELDARTFIPVIEQDLEARALQSRANLDGAIH